jgi:hypothetical protein
MRRRLDMAAMVAGEPRRQAMIDHPRRAVRALEAVAAIAAERQRRIAAPVEEQQRLLLGAPASRERLDQRRREPAPAIGRSCVRSISPMSAIVAPAEAIRAA